ncbi:MFS transporter [Cohnella panacarvi]|uniref:MFS transporter n=1 Tax=Cohnella panacarvi TaxID=400776 RepID=UPI00047ED7B8|nr:MFS transporter [Cohnella panacarvi]
MNEASSEMSAVQVGKEPIWTPSFRNLFIISALLNFGQFMMSALVPKFAEHLGASAAIIGTVSGMFAVTALAARPFVGPSAGYFRKNRLLAAAAGIILLAFVCYGAADSISMVMAGRLLHGIGMGLLAPVSLAMAGDVLPSRRLATGIGVFSLGQAGATAVGPSIGLELVEAFGYSATFWIGSVLMGIVVVLAWRLASDKPARGTRFQLSLHRMVASEVLIPTVILFFLAGAHACIQAFILIYGGVNGVDEIGLFFTTYAVCLLIARPLVGKIADTYGMDKVILPGILLFAVSMIVISYSRTLPMFLVAGGISSFGYGICLPSIQTLSIRLVASSRRAVASNTNYIGIDAGYLIAPAIAGLIISYVQRHSGDEPLAYAVMYRLMSIPIVVAFIIYFVYKKKLTGKLNDRS